MEKTTTLNIRINPEVKKEAEDVFSRLGILMSTAINMYLNQISSTGGIPFPIEPPQPTKNINANLMTDEELKIEILKGIGENIEHYEIIISNKAQQNLSDIYKYIINIYSYKSFVAHKCGNAVLQNKRGYFQFKYTAKKSSNFKITTFSQYKIASAYC